MIVAYVLFTCVCLVYGDDGSDFTPEDILAYLSANYRKDADDVKASSFFLPPRGLITFWTDKGDTYKIDVTSYPSGGTEETYYDVNCNDDLCYHHIENIIGGYSYDVEVTSDRKHKSSNSFYLPWQLTTETSSDSCLIEWDMSLDTCTRAAINPLCYDDDGSSAPEVTVLQNSSPVERKLNIASLHKHKHVASLHSFGGLSSLGRGSTDTEPQKNSNEEDGSQENPKMRSMKSLARGVSAVRRIAGDIMTRSRQLTRQGLQSINNWESKIRDKVKESISGLYLSPRQSVRRTFGKGVKKAPGVYIRRPPRRQNLRRKHVSGAPWWSFGSETPEEDHGMNPEDQKEAEVRNEQEKKGHHEGHTHDHGYFHDFFDFFGEEYPASHENEALAVENDRHVFFAKLHELQYYLVTLSFIEEYPIQIIVKTKLAGQPMNILPDCDDECHNGGKCVSSVLGLGRTELDSVLTSSCSCPPGFGGVNCSDPGNGDILRNDLTIITQRSFIEHAHLTSGLDECGLPSTLSLARYWCNGKSNCEFMFPRMQSYFPEANPCRYIPRSSYTISLRAAAHVGGLSCKDNQVMDEDTGTCYEKLSERSFHDAIDHCQTHGGDLIYIVADLIDFLRESFQFDDSFWTYGYSPVPRPQRLMMSSPEVCYIDEEDDFVRGHANLSENVMVGFCAFAPV